MKTLIIPNDHISKVCNLLNQLIGDVTSKIYLRDMACFIKRKICLLFGQTIRFTCVQNMSFR